MTSPRLTRSRTASQDSQQARAAAPAAAEAAVHLPAPCATAAAAVAATSEAGPSRRKRPLESYISQLSEDDFSCPICLNLLLDPVVGACGHDCCELCFRRWTVDQGKRSCPVCRAALAGGPIAPLPGVCLRLQRTLEQLFPERIKERQAEVAEQKRQLAAEKRRREEALRRAAAARETANANNDRLMDALLEHLLHEHAMGLASLVSNSGGPGAQRAQQPAAAQQQAQQARQTQQAQPGRMGRLLSNIQSLFGGRGQGGPGAAPSQQQQQDAAGQPAAGRPAPGPPTRPNIEVQFVHLVTRQGQTGPPQLQAQVTHLEIPIGALGLSPGIARAAAPASAPGAAGPAAAAAGARDGSSSGGSGSPGSAAWPEGPPLEDMHFEMGWGEQNRRRRGSRGSHSSGGSGGSGRR